MMLTSHLLSLGAATGCPWPRTEEMKMASKRITQETFDAAVRENIEEFEMGPEEAVKEAVEQFESQGRAVWLGLSAGLALCPRVASSPQLLMWKEWYPAMTTSLLAWQPWALSSVYTLPQARWPPTPTLLEPTLCLPGPYPDICRAGSFKVGLILTVASLKRLFLTTSRETGPPVSLPHLHPSLSSWRQKGCWSPASGNRWHAPARPWKRVVKRELFAIMWAGLDPASHSRDLPLPMTGQGKGWGSSDRGRGRKLGMNTLPSHSSCPWSWVRLPIGQTQSDTRGRGRLGIQRSRSEAGVPGTE